jgi:hypothetical protein
LSLLLSLLQVTHLIRVRVLWDYILYSSQFFNLS